MTAARGVVRRPRRGTLWRLGAGAFEAMPPVVALLIALVVWELVVDLFGIPLYLLPAPSAIVGTLLALLGAGFQVPEHLGAPATGILYDTYITLSEALVGLLIGTAIGLLLAVVMVHWRFAEDALYPVVVMIRATPMIAIAPVFIVWFGFTIMPKAIVAALATFYPVLVNSITGLRSVEPTTLEFFESVHASQWDIFWKLRVPSSLPYLFAALRLNVSLALVGAVVGELVGAREGLGHLITDAAAVLRTPEVFSGVIMLTFLGVVLTQLVSLVQSRVLFWHESERV